MKPTNERNTTPRPTDKDNRSSGAVATGCEAHFSCAPRRAPDVGGIATRRHVERAFRARRAGESRTGPIAQETMRGNENGRPVQDTRAAQEMSR